jgi:hypothetical protein
MKNLDRPNERTKMQDTIGATIKTEVAKLQEKL